MSIADSGIKQPQRVNRDSLALNAQVFAPNCFAGRSILITGASSGLGREAAIALSALGARLVLTGRDQGRLEETRARLGGEGHLAATAELVDADQTAEFIARLAKELGAFNGIFHSAGAYFSLPMKVSKQRHIDNVFAASVNGAYGIAKAASQRKVLSDGGSVVFMSSVAGERGHGGLAAYGGSKAAVLGLVRALALEVAPRRVRVNAITASTIETEMHLRTIENANMDYVAAGEARHPLGFGRPEDVANAVIFLLSDAAQWVTGTSLVVDGGYLA
jgi:NAD(P)-dependent dehydrogenase (short-subunit alcohol dehydrogenase family)